MFMILRMYCLVPLVVMCVMSDFVYVARVYNDMYGYDIVTLWKMCVCVTLCTLHPHVTLVLYVMECNYDS